MVLHGMVLHGMVWYGIWYCRYARCGLRMCVLLCFLPRAPRVKHVLCAKRGSETKIGYTKGTQRQDMRHTSSRERPEITRSRHSSSCRSLFLPFTAGQFDTRGMGCSTSPHSPPCFRYPTFSVRQVQRSTQFVCLSRLKVTCPSFLFLLARVNRVGLTKQPTL